MKRFILVGAMLVLAVCGFAETPQPGHDKTPQKPAETASPALTGETIDVNIKGMDDGKRTTRQRDYREAVLDAERQAIERAGVRIESKTTVLNAQLQSDYIESQAKAVLLPGFEIIDIGYTADGTYQVVLTGKVQVQSKPREATADSGALVLLMDIYSVPITFKLDGKPLEAASRFTALVPTGESPFLLALPTIREVKKRYNELPHYFLYLLKLAPGKHTLNITANIIGGSGPDKNGNVVEAEIQSGKPLIYEYRADPEYSFAFADSGYLFEKLGTDTTAAARARLRKAFDEHYRSFTGFKF